MLTIQSEPRFKKKTAATRRLRKQNKCPAIIYKDLTITLNNNDLTNPNILKHFYINNIIKLIINSDVIITVKIQDIHYHPFKSKIIHVDFIRIQ